MSNPEANFSIPKRVSPEFGSVEKPEGKESGYQSDFVVPEHIVIDGLQGNISKANDLLDNLEDSSAERTAKPELDIPADIKEGLLSAIDAWNIDNFTFETAAAKPPKDLEDLADMSTYFDKEIAKMVEFKQSLDDTSYLVEAENSSDKLPASESLGVLLIPWGWFHEQIDDQDLPSKLKCTIMEISNKQSSRAAYSLLDHMYENILYWRKSEVIGDECSWLEAYVRNRISAEGRWGIRYVQKYGPGLSLFGSPEGISPTMVVSTDKKLHDNLPAEKVQGLKLGDFGIFEALALEIQHNFPGYIKNNEVLSPNRVKATPGKLAPNNILTRKKVYQRRLMSEPSMSNVLLGNVVF